jgi:SAM-dependent methyltransferase
MSPPHPPTSPRDPSSGARSGYGTLSRFNAWFFTAFAGYINYIAGSPKRSAFAELTGPTVLELGAGTGANLGYLPAAARLIALEPNPAMHERLHRRCADAGVEVEVLPTGAEAIPLPDDSVDNVICSLVLCTVSDPAQVLAEVRRVLRPGGRFGFVEHIGAPPGLRKTVQRAVRRPWARLFEGCQLDRATPELVGAAGFESVAVHRVILRKSVFFPVNTACWGVAVK